MNATTAPEIAAFNALTQAAFHHEPRSPIISTQFRNQRWFEGDGNSRPVLIGGNGRYEHDGMAVVWRSARADKAYVELEVDAGTCVTRLNVQMTPAELREMAARLIDAAYDIELWPAARLATYDSLCDAKVPA